MSTFHSQKGCGGIPIFWGWGKSGKCIMHRGAIKASCVRLQQGLPVGLLARWTFCIPFHFGCSTQMDHKERKDDEGRKSTEHRADYACDKGLFVEKS